MSNAPSGRVFISYRRNDTRHIVGRLGDRLAAQFGAGNVFRDVDSIEPGLDFTEVVADAVKACDVLLVVIGAGWLNSLDERGMRRLENPDDMVIVEVGVALDYRTRIIPVLVDGAPMPQAQDLPQTISLLARRNAIRLDYETFDRDLILLTTALERVFGAPRTVEPHASDSHAVGLRAVEPRAVEPRVQTDVEVRESSHVDASAKESLTALMERGILASESEDYVEARAIFKRVMGSGDARLAPIAANRLGIIQAEHLKDPAGMRESFQFAIDSKHPEAAPAAAASLGAMLVGLKDYVGAKIAYEHAIASNDADLAPTAAIALGNMLAIDLKDYAGAATAYRLAIDSGHAVRASQAERKLKMLPRRFR